MNRRTFIGSMAALAAAGGRAAAARERRLLYVASPGIRNYVEFGGVGVLVFDVDAGHRLVRRIPTWEYRPGEPVENVKGIAACAKTGRLYVSTIKRMGCIDLRTERMLWSHAYPGGCDRMAIAPDGSILYVPSLEGPHWTVVDGATGEVITRVVLNSGAHNTCYGANGRRAYLAGLKSPLLAVVDTKTHEVVRRIGPFSAPIRPFTIDGRQERCYVNVNELLGFEIGDLKTGKKLERVEVSGFRLGPVKRHGCPSHGIGLTPDEREIWVSDGHNERVHVFDNTVWPPKQVANLKLREQPGWVTFSRDGKYAYPSTGEVFDPGTKKIVATLSDEMGRPVHSEKLLEVIWSGDRPVRNGDQFAWGGGRDGWSRQRSPSFRLSSAAMAKAVSGIRISSWSRAPSRSWRSQSMQVVVCWQTPGR